MVKWRRRAPALLEREALAEVKKERLGGARGFVPQLGVRDVHADDLHGEGAADAVHVHALKPKWRAGWAESSSCPPWRSLRDSRAARVRRPEAESVLRAAWREACPAAGVTTT